MKRSVHVWLVALLVIGAQSCSNIPPEEEQAHKRELERKQLEIQSKYEQELNDSIHRMLEKSVFGETITEEMRDGIYFRNKEREKKELDELAQWDKEWYENYGK